MYFSISSKNYQYFKIYAINIFYRGKFHLSRGKESLQLSQTAFDLSAKRQKDPILSKHGFFASL